MYVCRAYVQRKDNKFKVFIILIVDIYIYIYDTIYINIQRFWEKRFRNISFIHI